MAAWVATRSAIRLKHELLGLVDRPKKYHWSGDSTIVRTHPRATRPLWFVPVAAWADPRPQPGIDENSALDACAEGGQDRTRESVSAAIPGFGEAGTEGAGAEYGS